ncbi:hypothetical protein FQN52_007988 [Onygenales sp. PD_12]|nr:hypothetical protein FQN52_007988 [Onygenales sp. PD_12]
MLGKVISLKCDEEIINYLTHHMKESWTSFIEPNPLEIADVTQHAVKTQQQLAKIDPHIIETLQLMAFSTSCIKSRKVQGLILSSEIFSAFSEPEHSTI